MKAYTSWVSAFVLCMIALLLTGNILAQEASEAAPEKQKARISLAFFNKNHEDQELIATVKARVKGYFQNVPGVTINFYKDSVTAQTLLGHAVTDHSGRAMLQLADIEHIPFVATYVATLVNDPNYKDADNDLTVKKAVMEIHTMSEDSLRSVQVFVGAPDSTGAVVPAEGVTARIFVKRLFGMLPISDEFGTTDADGKLQVNFPSGIPGDTNGDLTLVAQVNDNDDYGNLEASESVPWGDPTLLDKTEQMKELWQSSANTSRFILFLSTSIMLGVVGVIVYIIRQLMNISRIGVHHH